MSTEMGRGFFRIATFIVVVSAFILPFLPSGSAEFYVDIIALVIGLVFMGVVAVLARRSVRG